jgi:hypothetical protein
MMQYQPSIQNLSNVRATHHTPGKDHLYYVDSSQGELWWLPVSLATLLIHKNEPLLASRQINLNVFGAMDLLWTSTTKQLAARSSARILTLANVTTLADITPAWMSQETNWTSVPVNNTVTVPLEATPQPPSGWFYAVRIPYGGVGEFHYAKLRIYKSGTQTWIEWATYSTSSTPYRLTTGFTDVRDILLSEDEKDLYLAAQYEVDGQNYVLYSPQTGNTAIPYPDFSSQAQPIHDEPLVDPRQMAMDGDYLYVVDSNTLWRINLLTRAQVRVVEGFSEGTGLLLSRQGTFLTAYLSDAKGHVFEVDLSGFPPDSDTVQTPPPLQVSEPDYKLNTMQSGSLCWTGPEHSAFYMPLQDKREVALIDLRTGITTIEGQTLTGVPGPWSVEAISGSKLYVACETEIGQFSRTIEKSSKLLLGIGLIPFGYINHSEQNPAFPQPDDGKVNTSSVPGYYFSDYPNLSFGGELSLMVNHELGWTQGIRFYSLKLTNLNSAKTRVLTDSFVDMKWDEKAIQPQFVGESTASNAGLYPIRNPSDLWYNPYLAAKVRTGVQDNGHNVLTVEFFDANKQPVANGNYTRLIFIDNTRCGGGLQLPRIGTPSAAPMPGVYPKLACGCLSYGDKNNLVELDFTAWQPQSAGTYSLRIVRGGANLAPLAQDGTVSALPVLFTKKLTAATKPFRVGHILGDCDVANVIIYLSVPARVIDGFGWVDLGAHDSESFTLIKGEVTHSPWSEP